MHVALVFHWWRCSVPCISSLVDDVMRKYDVMSAHKLKFHETDTDTDIDTDTDFLADFRARIGSRRVRRARMSARPAAARAARSAYRLVRGLLSDTRAFPSEDVRWGCARVHVSVYCT